VIFAQLSNTGTPATDRLRQRFGFFHTQLTNNDDILSLDYTTANFDEVHNVNLSYDRPFENDRIRWRAYGNYYEYTAADVGALFNTFKGESYYLGAEVKANIYQKRELFLDIIGGARFEHQETDNRLFNITGEEDFIFPYIGLAIDRTTEWFSTVGSALLEFQFSDLTDTDEIELVELGRTDPDDDWVVLRYNLNHSFYLEPLLDREAWEDPTTPESSTLAHEVRLMLRGQYSFGNRLIPQHQGVVGGLYTVRGYPESVIAGDSTVVATAEYRYHVPRAFTIQPEPREMFGEVFRAAPQFVYGVPDWDLVLKGFIDVGGVYFSDKNFFEDDETLIGAGIGFDFLYRRNVNIRVDWGFTLDDLDERNVNSGSNRLQFVATFLF
jgi:hemolysin activation/secretion protein